MDIREGYVICSKQTKEKILKNLNGFHQYIFLTMEELFFNLSITPKKKSAYMLMRKYQISYDLACEYLKGIPYIEDRAYQEPTLDSIVSVFHYLKEEKMLIHNDLFLIRLKQFPVTFINPIRTGFYENLKKKIETYTEVYEVDTIDIKYQPVVLEFSTPLEEGLYVFNQIKELLRKGISLNHIYLVNVSSNLLFWIHRLAENYQIPVELEPARNITGSESFRHFIELCQNDASFEEVISHFEPNEFLYDSMIQMINQYDLYEEQPKDCIEFIKALAKKMPYPKKRYQEAIHLVSSDMILDETDYAFFMDFSLKEAPKIIREEGFLNDSLLKEIHAMTSYEKNKAATEELKNWILKTPNLTLSYHQYENKDQCLPSLLVRQLNLEIVPKNASFGTSKVEDDLKLSSYYDDYLKYGIWHESLIEYGLNEIPYRSYKHDYQRLDPAILEKKFQAKPLKLAYSNLKLYYACPFGYYADRILGLNEFDPQMPARLGTFSHAVLEDSYGENFSFDESVALHTKENCKDAKDAFFFEQMTSVLRHLIDFNFTHEAQSKLKEIKREEHIVVTKENYQFEGYIDKLMYYIDGNDVYAAIIDYKTGKDIVSLDNIEDGFHLQLPSYMYLLSHYEPFKNLELHIIGIYLQKVNIILFDSRHDIESQTNKAFRLEGYTVKDMSLIPYLDPGFAHSDYIKSLSLTKDGFSRYAKIFKPEKQEEMIHLVDSLVENASQSIHNGIFDIAPKMIQGKNESCTFCKYKDVCFYDYKDLKELTYKPFGKDDEAHGMD